MRFAGKFLVFAASIISFTFLAQAATITGTVKGPDGTPFKGAFVEAQNAETKITVNVLSDRDGHYRVPNLPAGDYELRIRAAGYRAEPRENVSLKEDQKTSIDFALATAMVRWNDLSMYQGKSLFPENKAKATLTGQCWACHGFETRMASVVRDQDGWTDRVNYMWHSMGFFLNRPPHPLTPEMASDLATYLNSMFGEHSVLPKSPAEMPEYKSVVHPPFSDEAMKIVYVEYNLPTASSMPWSAVPTDEHTVWIPLWARGKIARLDPTTGAVKEYSVPYSGPFNAGIHSAVPAPDGSVWIAEQGSNLLAKWDPTTEKITEFNDGDNGKHTIRIGPTGEIWFSGTRGSYDPKTGKFSHYGGTAYGIVLDPHGNAWFASGNDIVRVDAETRAITKYTPPTGRNNPENIFNRRIQIDTDGTIWFAEYNPGKLTSFDPKTQQFKEYQLPGPAPTPYALGIDKAHNIWYSSELTDVVGCLDSKTGHVTEYPFPHSENTMREFFLDPQGRLWYGTAANNKVGYFYVTGEKQFAMR